VNSRNERGHSPVLIAQYHHKKDAVAVLLAAGPDLDLFDAASVGDTTRVAALLDRDPSQINAYSNDGFYPLGLAAFFGHPETVKLLIARGADVQQVARNPMKVQPLHAAVAGRSMEAVRALVEADAPIDVHQQEGWTPLHEAVHQGNIEMTKYLLAHGADPKLQNEKGKNAIGLAADEGNVEMLKLLKGQT
jgi:ankyrin repeat protein